MFEIDNESQKREQLIRELERRQARKRFNIIGFNAEPSYSNWTPKKHCAYHPGTRLIQGWDEKGGYMPGVLQCPQCGKRYTSESAPTEQGLKSKHGQTKPRIITAKTKKKKYHDKQGNLINDPDLIAEIQRGATVYRYHEEVIK
jgi:hypothetical protein